MVIEKDLIFPVILCLGFFLDQIIGDPAWLPHPVRAIGWVISKLDSILNRASLGPLFQRIAGIFMAIVVIAATFFITYLFQKWILTGLDGLWKIIGIAFLVVLTATTLASRELARAGFLVISAVDEGDIESARQRLAMIVGRDTANLDEKSILRAVMETLSENLSDGVIAPLFYLAVGGLPLGLAYKAVNTLDSMVGYKNERYRYFGWASARIDDVFNYIPARISGVLIVLCAAFVCRSRKSMVNSWKTMYHDGNKHSSPNSGYPEAAAAGALGVKLGGPSTYFGTLVEKPWIGTEQFDNYGNAAGKTLRLVRWSSWCGFFFALVTTLLPRHV